MTLPDELKKMARSMKPIDLSDKKIAEGYDSGALSVIAILRYHLSENPMTQKELLRALNKFEIDIHRNFGKTEGRTGDSNYGF